MPSNRKTRPLGRTRERLRARAAGPMRRTPARAVQVAQSRGAVQVAACPVHPAPGQRPPLAKCSHMLQGRRKGRASRVKIRCRIKWPERSRERRGRGRGGGTRRLGGRRSRPRCRPVSFREDARVPVLLSSLRVTLRARTRGLCRDACSNCGVYNHESSPGKCRSSLWKAKQSPLTTAGDICRFSGYYNKSDQISGFGGNVIRCALQKGVSAPVDTARSRPAVAATRGGSRGRTAVPGPVDAFAADGRTLAGRVK